MLCTGDLVWKANWGRVTLPHISATSSVFLGGGGRLAVLWIGCAFVVVGTNVTLDSAPTPLNDDGFNQFGASTQDLKRLLPCPATIC